MGELSDYIADLVNVKTGICIVFQAMILTVLMLHVSSSNFQKENSAIHSTDLGFRVMFADDSFYVVLRKFELLQVLLHPFFWPCERKPTSVANNLVTVFGNKILFA